MTIIELHARLDINGEGFLKRDEFIEEMDEFGIPGLIRDDLGLLYDTLDSKGNKAISMADFKLSFENYKHNQKP